MNYEKLIGASVTSAEVSLASTSYIDSLAEGGQHGTKEELEQKWEEAKKIANKNAKENPNIVESYAYTTAIFQDLIGVKQKASVALTATEVTARNNYLEKLVRDGKHGTRKHIMEQWEEAKAVANRVGIRAYPYMIAVFQNLLGIRKTAASVKIEAATRLKADADESLARKYIKAFGRIDSDTLKLVHSDRYAISFTLKSKKDFDKVITNFDKYFGAHKSEPLYGNNAYSWKLGGDRFISMVEQDLKGRQLVLTLGDNTGFSVAQLIKDAQQKTGMDRGSPTSVKRKGPSLSWRTGKRR